jgi:hypothetical protein
MTKAFNRLLAAHGSEDADHWSARNRQWMGYARHEQ